VNDGQTVPGVCGDLAVEIVGVSLNGVYSRANAITAGEEVILNIFVRSHEFDGNITAGFMIKDPAGAVIYGTNSYHLGREIFVERGKEYCIQFRCVADIGLGDYFIVAALHTGSTHYERCFHWWEKAARFSVTDCLDPMFVGEVRLRPVVRADEMPSGNPFQAELIAMEDVKAVGVREEIEVPMKVKNTSGAVWFPIGNNPVNVSYHWIDDKGETVVHDGSRTSLGRPVLPGDEITLNAGISGPEQPGNFTLRLTLVQEGIAWFEQRGVKTVDCPVRINGGSQPQQARHTL
jgi:Wzt-like putative exopolysaccharide export protein